MRMNTPTVAKSVIVCINQRFGPNQPSCAGRGSNAIADALDAALQTSACEVTRIKCLGRCTEGPNVRIAPGGKFFRGASLDDIPSIIAELE